MYLVGTDKIYYSGIKCPDIVWRTVYKREREL